jgi:hypothetical protein
MMASSGLSPDQLKQQMTAFSIQTKSSASCRWPAAVVFMSCGTRQHCVHTQRLGSSVPCFAGFKQSKTNPMLKLESSQVSPVLRFQNQQDKDDIVAAYTKAQTQQQAAAQAAAQPAAAAAPAAPTAAALGGHSASQLAQKVGPQEREELLSLKP